MTFGRKMDHGVERAGREQLADKGGVGYIALDEAVAGGPVRRQIGQIGGVARIGQLVQIDHPRIGALGQDQPDEIGADEAAASGDQKRHDALMVRLVEQKKAKRYAPVSAPSTRRGFPARQGPAGKPRRRYWGCSGNR